MTKPRTLYDKIWDDHVVDRQEDGTTLLYIDRHLVHEVTSPQAFEGLRLTGRTVRAPTRTLAVVDHNVPTTDRSQGIEDPESALQVATLGENASEFGIEYYNERDPRQGIVHIVGPEQGFTLPGMTIVCGDSHTSTHGAFGALAHGEAIRALSMEGRMTVCNMSIEGGARAGMIAPDETTYAYIRDRSRAPKDATFDSARAYWESLPSDEGAHFDSEIRLDVANLPPIVTWGTSPDAVVSVEGTVPNPADAPNEGKRRAMERALEYMGLVPGTKITDITIDRAFIGSCTNGRIEDLRAVARVVEGRTVHESVNALIVPGSGLVKEQAEAEGLHKIFLAAGFEWREPGCSMCLAMNADRLEPGERCASTSNRNFEGRQGFRGRTHLVSPAMAAAAAIAGRFVDIREFNKA